MSRSELLWLGLLVAIMLLPLLGFAPMIWRIVRHDEEPEPGGSLSRQIFGRRRRKQPEA